MDRWLKSTYPKTFLEAPETSKAVLFTVVRSYLEMPLIARIVLIHRACRYLRLLLGIIHFNKESNFHIDGHWHNVALIYQKIIEDNINEQLGPYNSSLIKPAEPKIEDIQ
jgi:hypothetical protein